MSDSRWDKKASDRRMFSRVQISSGDISKVDVKLGDVVEGKVRHLAYKDGEILPLVPELLIYDFMGER